MIDRTKPVGGSVDRRTFEHLLGGLVRSGLVEVRDASFEKDGERIAFQRASLTEEGWERAEGGLAAGKRVTLGEVAGPKKRKKPPKAKAQKAGGEEPGAKQPSAKQTAARRAFFARIKGRRRKG